MRTEDGKHFRGVSKQGSRYRYYFYVNGEQRRLGMEDTPEMAYYMLTQAVEEFERENPGVVIEFYPSDLTISKIEGKIRKLEKRIAIVRDDMKTKTKKIQVVDDQYRIIGLQRELNRNRKRLKELKG